MNIKKIRLLYDIMFDRKISLKDAKTIIKRIHSGQQSERQFLSELLLSTEFLKISLKNVIELHLYLVHSARLKMVSSLLPEARNIVDLGGANGSIFEMGYPFKFEKIIVVDLPPKERWGMYKEIELRSKDTPNGPIFVHFGNMIDLSFLDDESIDLVWSGESIEHISPDDGKIMVREAFRILKKGGYFCLDTPNRYITEIHTRWNGGGYIHPEHKIEYYPEILQKILTDEGFKIIEKRGICEMKNTYETKIFDYADYIFGNHLPYDINSAYIQFYKCQK
jgi:predicted SAM-dependent methyltransferase